MEKLTMMEGVSKQSAQWKTRVGSRIFFEIFETALESVPDFFFFALLSFLLAAETFRNSDRETARPFLMGSKSYRKNNKTYFYSDGR